MSSINELPKRGKGIYILPNLFTTACLFGGFYAIIAAINGDFQAAAIAILVAMLMDSLDGRIARMTNTQSEFGAQYDSLADLVAFGLAPALIMYEWSLSSWVSDGVLWAKLGWLAAFVYTVSAALRLARFNTNIGKIEKEVFQGLSSPGAAGVVVGMVWFFSDLGVAGSDVTWVAFFTTIFVGSLMVIDVPYFSGKGIDLKKTVPFAALLIAVMIAVAVITAPPTLLFPLAIIYALSGPVTLLWRLRKKTSIAVEQDKAA